MISTTPAVSRYHPLVLILVAAASGILLDRVCPVAAPLWWLTAAIAGGGWLFAWRRRHLQTAGVCLSISLVALGGAWHHVRWNLFAADDLAVFAAEEPRPVQLRATLIASPQRIAAKPSDPLNAIPAGERTRITLVADSIHFGDKWRSASGRTTLLVDGHALGFAVGDRVEIFGQLSKPLEPLNPGEFNFADQRRALGELSELWADDPSCITLIERPSGWNFWRGLASVRHRGTEQLDRRISRPRQATADALLLGTRYQLDEDLVQAYFLSGMVHLLEMVRFVNKSKIGPNRREIAGLPAVVECGSTPIGDGQMRLVDDSCVERIGLAVESILLDSDLNSGLHSALISIGPLMPRDFPTDELAGLFSKIRKRFSDYFEKHKNDPDITTLSNAPPSIQHVRFSKMAGPTKHRLKRELWELYQECVQHNLLELHDQVGSQRIASPL